MNVFTDTGPEHDYCDSCLQSIPVLAMVPGPLLCDTCRSCYVCGDSVEPPFIRVEAELVCDECRHDLLANCSSCESQVLDSSDLRTAINGEVCESCADDMESCGHCGLLAEEDTLTRAQNGNLVCDECRYRHYHTCDYCEAWIHDDDCCENEDCYPDYGDDYGGLIEDYSFKPLPQFHGDGRVFFGLELEVNHADYNCAVSATDHLGSLGYLKEDCSLRNGFEIVTHPMTHEYAAESFPWAMLRDLRNNGAESSGAGLHVHVNRSAFDGPAHVYRWLTLVYRNEHALTALSRRNNYDLAEWASFSEVQRIRSKDHAKGSRGGRRHAAVNVTNSATFEVRLFASSLNRQEVRAALDFMSASVEYTRYLTVPVILAGGWSWSAFGEWVGEREEYTALAAEMAARPPLANAPYIRPASKAPRATADVNSCPCCSCRNARRPEMSA